MTGLTHTERVVVLGGGIAGLTTALLLARDGHDVTLIERDAGPPEGDADVVFDTWARPGVGQFRQPHNFLGRGCGLLLGELPDVLAALYAAGAWDVDQAAFLPPDDVAASDGDLRMLACRRPVFDSVLHAACRAQHRVNVRTGETVTGLTYDESGVHGVILVSGEAIPALLVVDALGRTSPMTKWIDQLGVATLTERSGDCGVLYYSRHYKFHESQRRPPVSMMYGPRGAAFQIGHAVFMGEHDTFSSVIMVPPTDKAFRELRVERVYGDVAAQIPGLADWLAPECSEPLTPVLPMGHLRNVWRCWQRGDDVGVPGVQSIGDAACHTNPTFAVGASQAIEHAVAVRDGLRLTQDPVRLADVVSREIAEVALSRFEMVRAEDQERMAWWSGALAPPFTPANAPALYLRTQVYPASVRDPALFRAVARRVNLFDEPDALPNDPVLMARATELIAASAPTVPPVGPDLDAIRSALTA